MVREARDDRRPGARTDAARAGGHHRPGRRPVADPAGRLHADPGPDHAPEEPTSSTVAPPGPKPVEVLTNAAPASFAIAAARAFSSSVRSAASTITLTTAPPGRQASTTAATCR